MKKKCLKDLKRLALHKVTISQLYGGITDDEDDEDANEMDSPVSKNVTAPIDVATIFRCTSKKNCDHTRGCVSWNIAC